MIKQVISLLGLATLSACAPYISASAQENLVHRVMHSTIKVGGSKGHGSGFYVDVLGKGIAITNDHVCAEFKEIDPGQYLEFFDHSQIHDFDVLKTDAEIDLCAIKFKPQPGLMPLPLAMEEHFQEEVMVLGYPAYNPLMPIFGYTGDTLTDELHPTQMNTFVSAQIYPGNSGSPVVNMQGRVVGVISEGDSFTNRGRMVTYEHLKQFILGLY